MPPDASAAERDALLLVDLFNDFSHEDGERLLQSFIERFPELERLVEWARDAGLPVVYGNDALGIEHATAAEIVEIARRGPLGACVPAVEPRRGDPFFVKPLYSAFEATELEQTLRGLGITRLLLAGSATERCVTQTAVSARERDIETIVLTAACPTVDPRLEQIALCYVESVAQARVERRPIHAWRGGEVSLRTSPALPP